MLKRLVNKITSLATSRYAGIGLYFYAVVEAVIFLVPTDFLLISMGLLTPKKAQPLAFIAAIGSVTGALVIYAIGYFAFEALALPILNFTCSHYDTACPDLFIPKVKEAFSHYGFGLVAISIFISIIPRRLIGLVAGLTHMAIVPFILASLVGRWLRYAIVAELTKRYGEHATRLFRKNMAAASLVLGIVLVILLLTMFVF